MADPPSLPRMDHALLEETCRRFGVRLLILFGSRATGTPSPTRQSDLDLAVHLERGRDDPDFWEL